MDPCPAIPPLRSPCRAVPTAAIGNSLRAVSGSVRTGPMLEKTIFEGGDIRLRLIEPRPRTLDRIVVTFQARNPSQTMNRSGFAEEFLAKYRIPALHVTASRNHWYQVREMAVAMRRAARIGEAYGRVITYGSSMGAHAAVVFSGAVNADAVIALSPLYSIDPRIVPHDRRYRVDAKDMRFRFTPEEGARREASAHLFFDPCSLDGWHARRIAPHFDRSTLVPVPFAGHPCGNLLSEAGVLSRTIRDLIVGVPFDGQGFRTAIRAARAAAPSYWVGRARALRTRCPEGALDAARSAARLKPGNPVLVPALGDALSHAGRHDEATALLADLVRAQPRQARFHASLAQAYLRAGRVRAATDALEEAIRLNPADAALRHLRDTWRARPTRTGTSLETAGPLVQRHT